MLKNLIFLNPNFSYICLKLPYIKIFCTFLNKKFKIISLLSNKINSTEFKAIRTLGKFFLKTYSIHWFRVSFRGKGFRLRKFKKFNKLTLNFGHSHWSKVCLSTEFFFRKLKRQNYLCLIVNYEKFKLIKDSFKKFKLLNSYTKRGLRLRKQFIKRRFGKVSQVVSSLH